jgi:hypothetical protein
MFQVLVHVEGVEILRIKPGKEHVHHDGNVDLLFVRQVPVWIFLVLYALLDVLVVKIEGEEVETRAVTGVVIGDDRLERVFLPVGLLPVVGELLRQVFLKLGDVLVAVRRRREHAGDVERLEGFVLCLALGLDLLEQVVILDGVINRGDGQKRVEPAMVGGPVMLFQDRLDHLLLGQGIAGFHRGALGLVEVHVETKHVTVVDGVGDGVGMELMVKNVGRCDHVRFGALDGSIGSVLLKDGRPGKAEKLRPREKFPNGPVVLAELRAVAFVEDEHQPLVP